MKSSSIFICHAKEDTKFISFLCQKLKEKGFSPWLDNQNILPGQNRNIEIRRALKSAQFILVCLSHNSLTKRGYLNKEIKWSIDRFEEMLEEDIFLIPVKLEEFELPDYFSNIQAVNLYEEEGFEKLLSALNFQLSAKNTFLSENKNKIEQELKSFNNDSLFKSIQNSYLKALIELLSLQYPWGEWSDRRTSLETSIAERRVFRGPEGPKPNVARTLFAIEALSLSNKSYFEYEINAAYNWMIGNINRGWFKEWTSSASEDSEISIPNLIHRNDIRHSAQVATTICQMNGERDILAQITKNLYKTFDQQKAFWPESEENKTPKLLSTVYSVEFLGKILNNQYRLPIEDLLNKDLSKSILNVYRNAIIALDDEANKGNGLLGQSFRKATPYLTGLALFRLAPLAPFKHGMDILIEKMVKMLLRSMKENGWVDVSIPNSLRETTRKRTTLRIIAGLSRYFSYSCNLDKATIDKLLKMVINIISESKSSELDSPDYACSLICLYNLNNDIKELNIDTESVRKDKEVTNLNFRKRWQEVYSTYINNLSLGMEYNISGYQNIYSEMREKMSLLEH